MKGEKGGLERGEGVGVSDDVVEGRLIGGNRGEYVLVDGKGIEGGGGYWLV